MRDIKFRALSRATGKFVFGLPQYTSGGDIGLISGWLGDDGFEQYKSIEVIPESVSQFIGLKDKNGKDIYEGDILSFERNKSTLYKVIWDQDCWNAISNESDKYGPFTHRIYCNTRYSKENDMPIVIGNIHENPELLNA